MGQSTTVTRRDVLRWGLGAGAGVFVLGTGGAVAALRSRDVVRAARLLDPLKVAKYELPLVVPPAMPTTGIPNTYDIAVRQIRQQVLARRGPTTVWGYGAVGRPDTFGAPSWTIEATADEPVTVTWRNELVDRRGRYLPHLLPIDPTLHWANPPGGDNGRDMVPFIAAGMEAYRGPVPAVVHVHGAHTADWSDGYAEAWYLPDAVDLPDGYARVGTFYDHFAASAGEAGFSWAPGSATFRYPNDQAAATLWYHDHTLGMTRANVYAGPAGFYLVRGGAFDLEPGVLPAGPYELPLAIQDRIFDAAGELWYPDSRAFFDGFEGPFSNDPDHPSDIAPIWNPEVFGSTMLVNGRAWPMHRVEPRRYRLRLLNGCNSRFLILKLVTTPDNTAEPALPFWQVGGDGGFLPEPMAMPTLLLAPAERADVVVDFAGVTGPVYLVNEGPDEPFGGGVPGDDFPRADPATTGQVLRFDVVPGRADDPTASPDELELPVPPLPAAPEEVRRLALVEMDSGILDDVGPRAAALATVDDDGTVHEQMWDSPITERVELGQTEVWELHNLTMDAHPIHLHQSTFAVVDRQPLEQGDAMAAIPTGAARPPEPNELGLKDTVVAYPGEVTRVRVRFDLEGLYVWHCHILEHEDNEMMRPFWVGAEPDPTTLPRPLF